MLRKKDQCPSYLIRLLEDRANLFQIIVLAPGLAGHSDFLYPWWELLVADTRRRLIGYRGSQLSGPLVRAIASMTSFSFSSNPGMSDRSQGCIQTAAWQDQGYRSFHHLCQFKLGGCNTSRWFNSSRITKVDCHFVANSSTDGTNDQHSKNSNPDPRTVFFLLRVFRLDQRDSSVQFAGSSSSLVRSYGFFLKDSVL